MKRYLMSSNSIMNLNDKKSLDFQSISIVQNNNFVFAQYCVFSKYLQFHIIFIQFQFYQGRQYGAVCQPVQRSETGPGKVTLVPWLLNIFGQHGEKIFVQNTIKNILHTQNLMLYLSAGLVDTKKK